MYNRIRNRCFIVDVRKEVESMAELARVLNGTSSVVKDHKKVKQKEVYNSLVSAISHEYTFKLPDDRAVMGVDLTQIGEVECPPEIFEAVRFINDCTKHNIWDEDIKVTFAYVIMKNQDIITALIDGYSGEWLAFVKEITDELTEQNKEFLHKYTKEYLEKLEITESIIKEKLDSRGA